MQVYHFPDGPGIGSYLMLMTDLMVAPVIHTGEWQAMDTSKSSAHRTHEIEDVSLVWDQIPDDLTKIVPAIDINWADEHFAERVSGHPYNPAPSHVRWPYAVRANADHTTGETFDHTYPERFWPQHAGHAWQSCLSSDNSEGDLCGGTPGIRFNYGDLDDVVSLLLRHPLTRQAYLPVWFPEDTGAVEGQRVPCTLGYHFMQRHGFLSCRYYIRSVDAYRHLSNDVYFTARLMGWICDELKCRTQDSVMKLRVRPGALTMHIASLHSFTGDYANLRERLRMVGNEA